MFTYLKIKNYKSFDDLTIDFTDKNGKPKKLVVIYGENATGKTNIASTFYFLSEILHTMDVRDLFQSILSKENDIDENFINFLKDSRFFHDLESLIKDTKTIDSKEPMYVEYGFTINNKKGVYIIETDQSQIIREKLEYTLTKNRGVYFDLTPNSFKFNKKLSNSQDVYEEIKKGYYKFWGKHCMLSIISHEIIDKSDSYIRNQLNENFKILLNHFFNISVRGTFTHNQDTDGLLYNSGLSNLSKGIIKEDEINQLMNQEKSLKIFFPLINPDIQDVYYDLEKKDKEIQYTLYFNKYISGKKTTIPYYLESNGNQQILKILPYLYKGAKGYVSIIDEFDLGIHSRLNQMLIHDLIQELNGQLILTAHDLALLDTSCSGIPNDSIYMIYRTDNVGNREIKCLTKIDSKLNANSNISKQYLSGKFNIPDEDIYYINDTKIDYKEIFKCLEK